MKKSYHAIPLLILSSFIVAGLSVAAIGIMQVIEAHGYDGPNDVILNDTSQAIVFKWENSTGDPTDYLVEVERTIPEHYRVIAQDGETSQITLQVEPGESVKVRVTPVKVQGLHETIGNTPSAWSETYRAEGE